MSRSRTKPEAAGLYSVKQVAALLQVPERKLRYWSQTGFVVPSARRGTRSFYEFRDLIAVKVAKALCDRGIALRRVRRALLSLKSNVPSLELDLPRLRLRLEGERVVIDESDHSFEAPSGQLLLDFSLEHLHEQAARVVALPEPNGPSERSNAFEWFQHACELEAQWGGAPADIAGFEAAKAAYARALELDPGLAAAWTNLGGLMAEHGDLEEAERCFHEAARHDPEQPEAACNLAEILLRRGDTEAAIDRYRQVLRKHPDHVEAHYGLARALLEVGGRGQALAHLERFVAAVAGDHHELAARRESALEVIAALRTEQSSG